VAEVRVPDIGDFKDVPVIEVMVKPGDEVKAEDSLVTLESDKATMDVPAPLAGKVQDIRVKVGDKVSEGTLIMTLVTDSAAAAKAAPPAAATASAPAAAAAPAAASLAPATSSAIDEAGFALAYAGPGVRKLARELGVNLAQVKGSGNKGRIVGADVEAFAKGGAGAAKPASAAAGAGIGGIDLLPWPKVDFAKFGEIETKPLSRIQKISGANLARNWVMIPHVTHNDDADITELEALRVSLNKEYEKAGVKFTMLGFLIKAMVAALKKFPTFNASLDASGENLVLKKYYNVGFAADTPNGLVVPVLKDADKKGIVESAKEISALAAKARDGKLGPAEMSGGCISISSLGGIGGTSFTPIVNAPEVAILGVTKSAMRPVWDGKAFQPRLILPLSLSYDHRVIDGALAARFTAYLAQLLADMRRAML